MIHISDIKKFLKCERLYFYSKDENTIFKPYLRSDENINNLLIDYFGIEDCFIGERNDLGDKFFDNMQTHDWFLHPRFVDGELRLNIPLMHKNEDGFDLYYIYYVTQIREIDVASLSIGIELLSKQGLNINNIYIVYFNGEYVNDGKLDAKKLFLITDEYKEKKLIKIALDNFLDYKELIDDINNTSLKDYKPKKCKACKLMGLCDYYHDCFPDEESLADDSILTLVSSANKNKMYENGITSLKDVDINMLEGNRVQYAQIMASKNGGLFIDRLALMEWLNRLDNRPISFIDFEWDRYIVPEYKGMKPLDVLCFEYALYYIDEQGKMEHKTFVGTNDCRKEFVESLIENLPKEGPILAYNAYGAECLRLVELGELYPEYKQTLDSINSRFIDLATPFLEGLIYDTRMAGNYTLKKLVDIVSDYSYKNLDIDDGMQAVYNWRDIDRVNSNESEKIIDNLKEYCSLDAYGLFLVYRWLIETMLTPQKQGG